MIAANKGQKVQISMPEGTIQGIVKSTQIIHMPNDSLADYQRIFIECLPNPEHYVSIEAAAYQFDYC